MGRHGFSRLIWKEFHTQGSLWLALAIGTLLLLSLQLMPTDAFRNMPGYAFYVALVMTACYAGASGAILFAGEREEKTDDWLRQLPMRARTFIGAKFTWLLASTLLFGAFAGTAGWTVFEFVGGRADDETPFYVVLFGRALASMMVWSVLFSLLFHRVLLALLTALIMEFVFSITVGNLPVSDWGKDALFATVVLAVAIADVVLAVRWLKGQPFRIGSNVRRERVQTCEPTTQLRCLQWSAGRPSLLARMLSVLVWREARGAIPFLVWWGLTGILCILLTPLFGLNHLYLAATPALCGLLTYIGDRRQRDFRFYVERGISPRHVWLSKQLVWGMAALVIVTVFYTVDTGWNRRVADSSLTVVEARTWSVSNTIGEAVRVPWKQSNQRPPILRHDDVALQQWFVWLAGLSLFGLGQLAAIWIPRAIMAAAFVFILAPFTVLGLGGLVALDVPLSATAFPLAVLLFAATLFTFGDCLLERRTWQKRFAKIAWVAVPCLLFFVQFRSIRALPAMEEKPPVDVRGIEFQTQSADPTWVSEWRALLGELPAAQRLLNQPQEEFTASAASRIAGQMDALGTQLATRQTPLPPVMFLEAIGAAPGTPGTISQFSRRYANSQTSAGQHRQAWQTLLNAARISSFLSQQVVSWVGWYEALTAHNATMEAMREWATSADVPTDVLQTALSELKTLQQPLSARSMLERRYVVMRQLLEQRGPAWEWAEQESAGQSLLLDAVVTGGTLTGDKARLRGLLDYATAAALDSDEWSDGFDSSSAYLNQREEVTEETFRVQLIRAAASTALVPPQLFSADPVLDNSWRDLGDSMRFSRTQQHATLLVLALQVWHREHGQFPQHLSQLTERLLADLPLDHLSRGGWGYAPEGLPAPLLASRKTVIPAGQPLLWSRGWIDGDVVYQSQPRETGVGRTPPNRYVVVPFYRPIHDTRIGVNDSNGGEPQPDQIRFLILGAD